MKKILLTFASFAATCALGQGQCLTTTFGSNNNAGQGWAVFMDATVINATTIFSIESNFVEAAGTPVTVEIYTTNGSYVGLEGDPNAWTLVADNGGNSFCAGIDLPTIVELTAPFVLEPGLTGIAIVAVDVRHQYTDGDGTNQTYTDGNVTLGLGAAASEPFVPGTLTFEPRVWNGSMCTSAGDVIGTTYCSPGVINSTGQPGVITATGDLTASSNDLALTASGLPDGQFAFFIGSQFQGFIPNPNNSQGNLCVVGTIARFVGQLGQVSGGVFFIDVDLTSIPVTPSVAVMAGETWNFQCWHRDLDPVPTSNFTDAVSITFQ